MKTSTGKVTLPGRKQVYRIDADGRADHDVIALIDESIPDGRPLLEKVMTSGRRVRPPHPIDTARERARREIARLPGALRSLEPALAPYAVRLGPRLAELQTRLRTQLEGVRA